MSNSITAAAQSIVATMKRHYSAPHTMVLANESEFDHLDLGAYRSLQKELEASGFRAVGDVEILEVSNSPTTLIARTMIRNMLSADGLVLAQYYQVKPRIGRRLRLLLRGLLNGRWIDAPKNFLEGMKTRHCTGFETEFDHGGQLVTSNAQAASAISGPSTIENIFFPYGTPISILMSRHLKRLADITAAEPKAHPVPMQSLEAIFAMQRRQNLQKIAHRSAVQWVTQTEVRDMSGGKDQLSDAVFAEVQRLLAEEQLQNGNGAAVR
jgi:hypothetical protein